MEKLYALGEIAGELDVSYQTVWRWVKIGRIKAFRTPGNQWRVSQTELNRILGGE